MSAKKKTGARASRKARDYVPTRDGWVMRHWGQETPSYEKLQEAIAALGSDQLIDRATRSYISEVLDWLYVCVLREEEERHQRGRRQDHQMRWVASIAIALVDRYNVPVKSAIGAMLTPNADPKLFESLSRTYRNLRRTGNHYKPIDRIIEEAAQRLPISVKRK